ncbi:MAG: hypothetical protein ACO3A4_04980 [Silvanigrellaceae bacterium]
MWNEIVGDRWSKVAILLLLVAGGCAGNSISTKGGNVVGTKKGSATSSQNCQKGSVEARLTGSIPPGGPLGLTTTQEGVDAARDSTKLTKLLRTGGYVDISFHGVATNMAKFQDEGNPSGYVDVLNIPYCTATDSPGPSADLWISRCLSRVVQRTLQDLSVKNEFLSKWQKPRLTSKRCTAQFSMDPKDTVQSSGGDRLRVWTAEHCYQPAYADAVTLQVFLPVALTKPSFNLDRGAYVPVQLSDTDGGSWRRKIISTAGGNGLASDPKLNEKILILRSTDGRSSQSYMSTLEKFCVNYSEADFPKLNGEPPKFVDCFSMSDVGTFKGTISSAQIQSSQNSILDKTGANALEKGRKLAVDYIRGESLKAGADPGDNQLVNSFNNVLSGTGKLLSVNKFLLSIADGLQHGRRLQAYDYEMRIAVPSELKDTDSEDTKKNLPRYLFGVTSREQIFPRFVPFQKYFTIVSSDFPADLGKPGRLQEFVSQTACNYIEEKVGGGILGGIVNAGVGAITGTNCARRDFQPPDSEALEELALKDAQSFDLLEFVSRRPGVFLFKIFLSAMTDANHPLAVRSTDSMYTANLKFMAFQLRFWFEVLLMNKEPFKEAPRVQGLARAMQGVLQATCALAPTFLGANGDKSTLGGRLGALAFPVFGNASVAGGPLFFNFLAPVAKNNPVAVIPIGMDDGVSYAGTSCDDLFSRPAGFGAFDQTPVGIKPKSTVYGVRINNNYLTPGPEQDLMKYVSSRVVFKFEGVDANDGFQTAGPGDSGTMFTFLAMPSFVLSTHNGVRVNGVVLPQLPELNEPVANPANGSGGPCN